MTIPIKGIIGWDVVGIEFAERIARLNGDIDFEIDSPGGSVYDGISIFNAIKNYKKGKCNIKVVGDCSSMAAYIMLAGDTLQFESNSVVCLHNPWNVTVGDYNAMQKSADLLEKLAAMYAIPFIEKGIFEEKEIRSIMDAETWFVGAKDLRQFGEIIGDTDNDDESDNDDEKEIRVAACRERMNSCVAKLREMNNCNVDKIAALISQTPVANKQNSKIQTVITQQEKGVKIMNVEQLKKEHASLFNEVFAMGEKAGEEKERARVAAFMGFIEVDKDATIKALTEGKDVIDNEFQAAILQARIKTDTLKAMQEENPEKVDPQIEEHAAEQQPGQEDNEAKEKAAKEKAEKDEKEFASIMAKCGYPV